MILANLLDHYWRGVRGVVSRRRANAKKELISLTVIERYVHCVRTPSENSLTSQHWILIHLVLVKQLFNVHSVDLAGLRALDTLGLCLEQPFYMAIAHVVDSRKRYRSQASVK